MMNVRKMPVGSSAFAQVMTEISETPSVEITNMDALDRSSTGRRESTSGHHHEEGMMVHGLHHCYKVEGGQCLTSFRCNHDHSRASHGHLNEISKCAGLSPTPSRRMSIASSGAHLLSPDDDMFRPRANSDAMNRRRASMFPENTLSGRRGSNTSLTAPNGRRGSNNSINDSPTISPAPKRRGSTAVLHSQDMHYVYDQMKRKQ